MNIEFVTYFLYIWLSISLVFPFCAAWLIYRMRRQKREFIKQTFTTRHYEEMLYAAKDGYLTYSIYKKKEYQFCSRRLATLLNLKNGENSTIEEVFGIFETPDTEKLNRLFNSLKNTGTAFETLVTTKNGKNFTVTGVRINSDDMEINSDCLWFRDITKSAAFVDRATEEAYSCRKQLENIRILIDNLPIPIWMRDDKLNLTLLNRPYLNLLGLKDFKDLNARNSVLHDLGNTSNLLNLAETARDSHTPQKKQINILNNGDLRRFEITETPYYDTEQKISYTIGSLIDITKFDEAKRSYRVHLNSHLEILSALNTAFCIIDTKHNFTFGNAAFLSLWNLPQNFLDNSPHYNAFLDKIREQKTLPDVPDFKLYKEEENKAFDALTEQREDLLYIPDGRTIRRFRSPHPDGTIIAYEDITDSLATTRDLGDLLSVQKGILENIEDAVIILSPSLKIKHYNMAFLKLWNINATDLDNEPSLREVLDMQKNLLPELEDWNTFRENMLDHITACTPFTLQLNNKKSPKVTPVILSDSSLMITYRESTTD